MGGRSRLRAVTFSETPGDGQNDGQATVTGEQPAAVTVVNTFGEGTSSAAAARTAESTGEPAAVVAGEALTAPAAADTLPRTGSNPGVLASVGAWALAVGGLTLIATRRR